MFDPLALATADGKVEPYLAESITPNADYTVWTIKARSGITFHDGTPFDGAAIVDNLTRQFKSFLTGKVFSDVATNADGSPQIVVDPADPMSAQITMKTPWVPFPIYLTGQIGYMASPTWMAAADKDPTLEGQARRHRPVRVQGLQAGRVVQRDEEPELLEQAVPVPRRGRVPCHPGRQDARRRRSRPAT